MPTPRAADPRRTDCHLCPDQPHEQGRQTDCRRCFCRPSGIVGSEPVGHRGSRQPAGTSRREEGIFKARRNCTRCAVWRERRPNGGNRAHRPPAPRQLPFLGAGACGKSGWRAASAHLHWQSWPRSSAARLRPPLLRSQRPRQRRPRQHRRGPRLSATRRIAGPRLSPSPRSMRRHRNPPLACPRAQAESSQRSRRSQYPSTNPRANPPRN